MNRGIPQGLGRAPLFICAKETGKCSSHAMQCSAERPIVHTALRPRAMTNPFKGIAKDTRACNCPQMINVRRQNDE